MAPEQGGLVSGEASAVAEISRSSTGTPSPLWESRLASCRGCRGPSAANSRVRFARGFADDVLEELVAKSRGVIQLIGRTHLGRDHELAGADERLESNRIIFQGPCEPHAVRELGEPVPPERPDPGSPERLDQRSKVEVCGEVRLEDGDARVIGPQGSRTQDLHGPLGHSIAEFGVLDQIVLGQPMEGPGQLLRMDPESSAEALECDLGGRVLR